MPSTFRNPRMIGLERNDPGKFSGEGDYDAEAGVPKAVGLPQGKEQNYLANPINQADPAKEWSAQEK